MIHDKNQLTTVTTDTGEAVLGPWRTSRVEAYTDLHDMLNDVHQYIADTYVKEKPDHGPPADAKAPPIDPPGGGPPDNPGKPQGPKPKFQRLESEIVDDWDNNRHMARYDIILSQPRAEDLPNKED